MEGDGRLYDSFERQFNNTADDYDHNNRESYLSLLLRTSPPPPNEMNISNNASSNNASGPGLLDLNNAPLESSNNMNSFGMKDVPIVNPTQSTHLFQGMHFANPTTVEYNGCERNRLFPILESQDYSGFGQQPPTVPARAPTPAQTQQGGHNSPRVEEIMFGGRIIRATPVELIPAAHISGTARGAEAPFSGPPNVQGLPPLTFSEASNFPPVQFVGYEMPPILQQPILPTFDQNVPQPTLLHPQLYNLDYELGNEMHVDPQFTSLDFGLPLNISNALQQMDEDPQFTSLSLGMPGINDLQQQTFVQPPFNNDEFQVGEDEDMEDEDDDDEEDDEEEDEEEDLLYIDAGIDIAVDVDAMYAMELQLQNLYHPGLVGLEEALVEIINPTGLQENIIRLLLRRETYPAMANGTAPDDADASSCCICQDEYQGGQELGGLNCHHKFHFDCILEWLKRKNSCPLCRNPAIIDLTNE